MLRLTFGYYNLCDLVNILTSKIVKGRRIHPIKGEKGLVQAKRLTCKDADRCTKAFIKYFNFLAEVPRLGSNCGDLFLSIAP